MMMIIKTKMVSNMISVACHFGSRPSIRREELLENPALPARESWRVGVCGAGKL